MPEDKLLFTNDAFGQHYASAERFDDECPIDIVLEEAKKYYANIVLPYGKQVGKAYDAVSQLDTEMILPSHGVIWRKHVSDIFNQYVSWVGNKTCKKALVVYDTMWHSTEMLAKKVIAEAFGESGYNVEMKNLQVNHISDIMAAFMDAEYLCVGSPTLNNTLMPSVAAFLTYFRGLSPGNRKAVSFGSYGWGGQSIDHMNNYLKESNMILVDSVKVKYIPDDEEILALKKGLKEKIQAAG
jgi:flavorubredoxin